MNKKTLFGLVFVSALLILGIAGCGQNPKLNALANCLADKNVREYGAFWCGNCADQAEIFGSADKILKERGVYVECDPRCLEDEEGNLLPACRGNIGNPDLCAAAGVSGYPTWEFDGVFVSGKLILDEIAEKAGCEWG